MSLNTLSEHMDIANIDKLRRSSIEREHGLGQRKAIETRYSNNVSWQSFSNVLSPQVKGCYYRVLDHVAGTLHRIATSDPQSIKNKQFSAVTFWPTGQELVDLYTKLNGSQATVKDWTTADREVMIADGANFGPAKVGYWDRWESGDWGYDKNGRIVDKEYNGPGLEEIGRRFV